MWCFSVINGGLTVVMYTCEAGWSHSKLLRRASSISRVSDQNGVSRLYNMHEIYHSGPEPLISSWNVLWVEL